MSRLATARLSVVAIGFLLLGSVLPVSAQNRVLLIASSYGKGVGPFTSTIETPLEAAGYDVRVWAQLSQGWPRLDTLLAYDAVFFHGSERTMAKQVDSTLTAFAEAGGRLVLEGTTLAQWGTVYWNFRKHALHCDWRWTNVSNYTYQIFDTLHPITAGFPATINTSGYYSATPPDYAIPWFGGKRLIGYQNAANSAALIVYPRTVFLCGSMQRISSAANRDSLIVRSVRYVLSDPQDASVWNIDYELGHRAGDDIPVTVTVKNWSGSAAEGMLFLDVSPDSINWNEEDSVPYLLAAYGTNDFELNWHPVVAQRYYVRARIVPDGTDEQAENNAIGMRVMTLVEAVHPKLFFTAADVPTLQEQAATTHAAIAQAIEDQANLNLNFTLPPTHQWYLVNFSYLAAVASIGALQAVLNPTPTYMDHAKRAVLGMCRYPHWEVGNTNQDIYSGRACQALAFAYDWLYDEFSPAERDTVQIKLRTQMERLDAAGAQYIWWDVALIHNHNWNCMGYLGAAAFALLEEEPDAAIWEQHAISNLDLRMQLYGDVEDGSWYEAMNYWGFITWSTLPHVYLLREQMALNYFDRPFFQSLATYRVHGTLPQVNSMLMINDGQPDEWYGPQEQLALLAREYDDGEAQWLRNRINEAESFSMSMDGPLDFFWYDPTVPETVPTELSKLIPDQDTYFARSDWTPDATFWMLKCGLPAGRNAYETFWSNSGLGRFSFSHFAPDQNSFALFYDNHYLVQSSGVQSPHQFTRHSTTLLINGHGQVGDSAKGSWITSENYASYNPHLVKSFGSPKIDYVVGDASTCYPILDGLTRFHRHMLYVRPSTLIIFDDIKAQGPKTFSFVLQHPQNIWTWDTARVLLTQQSAQMAMRVLEPPAWTATAAFDYYYSQSWGGWNLRVTPAVADSITKFLMVLNPTTGGEPVVSELTSTATLTAVEINDASGHETQAMFQRDGRDSVAVDSISTDAELAVIRRATEANELQWCSVNEAQFLRWGADYPLKFSAPEPIHLEWEYRGDTLALNGEVMDGVRVWAPLAEVVTDAGESIYYVRDGEFIMIAPEPRWPLAVSDVTILATGDSISLHWTRVTEDNLGDSIEVSSYSIFRSLNGGPLELAGSVPGTDSVFVDTPLLNNATVTYDVRAEAPAGRSSIERRVPAGQKARGKSDLSKSPK